jgi:hypothetical protein
MSSETENIMILILLNLISAFIGVGASIIASRISDKKAKKRLEKLSVALETISRSQCELPPQQQPVAVPVPVENEPYQEQSSQTTVQPLVPPLALNTQETQQAPQTTQRQRVSCFYNSKTGEIEYIKE